MSETEKCAQMHVVVVGGTGLLGYHATLELLRRGHRVTVLALDLPVPDLLPAEVGCTLGDFNALTDEDVRGLLHGQDAIVFAAGADDRSLPLAPASAFFHKHNVETTDRLFRLAREAGIRRGVVCSSYFAYFDRTRPEWRLTDRHPYIRSRVEQARAAIEAGGDSLAVCILELPYVFGCMPGRKPLWYPLVQYLRSPWPLFYTKGGTNMVAVGHVAEAIAGAVEQGEAGRQYVIGDENRTWPELLEPLSVLAGRPKRVRRLPSWLIWCVMLLVGLLHRIRGRESGLCPTAFVRLQTSLTFFDPEESRQALGYGQGGLDEALRRTVEASSPLS